MLRSLFILAITHVVLSSAQDVSDDDIQKFADANNKLASNLYPRLIEGNSNNVVLCPGSLMTGLGMMLYGARGNTQEELHSVLGYKAAGLSNDKVPSTYHYIFTTQLPEDDISIVNYTMNCGSEIVVKKSAPLYGAFKSEAEDQFVATATNADFANDAQNVARSINDFVEKSTYGKIEKVVNSVSPNTSSLVIDTVHFKGKWATPFPSSLTSPQLFYSQSIGQQSIPFMQVSGDFPYTESDGYQAAFLPYVGNNVGLLVILPTQRYSLSTLEKTMTPDKIVDVLNQLQSTKIKVSLPKFNVHYYRDLANDFRLLGAVSAYDGSGDFSGMTSNTNLVVSGPIHKVFMEVDEGEQSASSAPEMQGDYKSFNTDHPFMLSVVDRRDNMLIFLGRITSL